jgi:hypothetical protein
VSDWGSGGLRSRPPVNSSLGIGTVDEEPSVTLAAGELEATFPPGLGLLGTSLRHRGEELLALPGGVAGYRDGHVTGLPILAPWANRLPAWRYRAAGVEVSLEGLELPTDPGGLPIHGTLTAHRGWRLERLAAEAGSAVLQASLDYAAYPELLAAFPFPHRLTVACPPARRPTSRPKPTRSATAPSTTSTPSATARPPAGSAWRRLAGGCWSATARATTTPRCSPRRGPSSSAWSR